jgi:hypothetical protein
MGNFVFGKRKKSLKENFIFFYLIVSQIKQQFIKRRTIDGEFLLFFPYASFKQNKLLAEKQLLVAAPGVVLL